MIVKKKLATAVLSAFITVGLNADTTSIGTYVTGQGVLENDYVRAGVNATTGTFGSGGNTSPGLLYDSTGTGSFNTSYDYLTPGSPFDGFSVKVDGTNYSNNNAGGTAIVNDGNGLTDGENSLSWTGGVTSVFDITNTYTLGTTSEYVDISSQITMGTAATDVYFGRFIDPDARAATGDSSSTDNVLGYGVIPDSNVAFSEALSSRYALGLYSTDSNVDAGISRWSSEADGYTENTVDGDGSLTNTGDNTIGLSWHWTSVSAGDILTSSYAYIFGPSAFDAADEAVTSGAGGGDTTTTDSWGTLTDVGSATDAAEGTTEPTVTSTSAPTTTYSTWSAWETNTALPVLTQTQTTHDASETATVQTIDRETTTIVTTPEKRTRTATTSVVDTYSDGSTVTRTTATATETETQNTAVSTVTDPGSFTGRIDQVATANDIHNAFNHSINFDRVELINNKNDYDNGTSGDLKGFVIGGEKELANGLVVNGGFSKTSGDFTNTNKTTTSGTVIGGGVKKKLESGSVAVNVNHASTDIEYNRTIGDFANAGLTNTKDTWLNVTYVGDGEKIRPILGVTKGKRTTDAYTETGSIQSARTVAETKDSYTYATVGFQAEHGPFGIEALKHTNGTSNITALYNHKVDEDKNFSVGISRGTTELGSSTSIVTGFIWRF